MATRTNTAKWIEKEKRWQILVQKDGVRKAFRSSTPGKKGQREANAKADQWLDDNIENTSEKISTLWDEYVENLKMTTSKSNWKGVESYGRKWIIPNIGRKKIGKLTEQDLQDVINKAFKADLSRKTLDNIRSTMCSFIKFLRKKHITTLFPESLTIPKAATKKEKRILQPEEIAIVFSHDQTTIKGVVQPDPLINAYRFQIATGLRPGEILGLQWRDIDFKTGLVHIRRSKNIYNQITNGKTANAQRTFALSPITRPILEDQRKINAFGFVFGDYSEKQYYSAWCRFCDFNGIPHTTLYELRHTFISIIKNLPEGQIRSIVGHSKNMDTFGVYGHAVNGEMQKTALDITELLMPIITQKK